MVHPAHYSGLAELADRYDGFLLDSWGVLQNGVAPLPGANDCLHRLHALGKHLIILSNSARRSHIVRGELARVGLAMECIATVITGGEAAWQALDARPDADHKALGRICYYLGSARSRCLLDGLDLDVTGSVGKASFILCASPPDEGITPDLHALLDRAAARSLTMVCANPDLAAHYGEEKRACAGEIARLYEMRGGRIIYHGKPHRPFYAMALAGLAGTPSARILAVGDAFATDMAGAAGAGIDALFVMAGLHREKFNNPRSRTKQLDALCRERDLWPVGAVQHFSW